MPLFDGYGVEPVIEGMLSRRVDLPERRLPDDRLRRGAHGHRRQHGLVHRQGQERPARGHDHQDEPGGGRGGRQPAAAPRHRRHHRHRLHRHGPRAQPRGRPEGAAQGARRGPHEDLRGGDLPARAGRDDAPERDGRRARDHDQDLPDLRRRGRREVRGDDRHRGRAPAARARRRAPARTAPRPTWSGSTRRSAPTSPPTARACCTPLEAETGRFFHFEGSEGLPLEHFAITAEGSRAEMEERAVPFREGEEVHVDLVEPHMYSEDDAVAKVDGYLIEVADGIPYVGEKKLVRIEQAGRTAARAVLAGPEAEEAQGRHRGAPRGARALGQAGDDDRPHAPAQGRGRRAAARARGRRPRRWRCSPRTTGRCPRPAPRRPPWRTPRRTRRSRAGGGARRRRRRTAKPRERRGAAAEADAGAAKPRGRRRARTVADGDRAGRGGRSRGRVRGRLGGRRRGTLEDPAPRPQRRTAPFAREGRSRRRRRLRSQRVIPHHA